MNAIRTGMAVGVCFLLALAAGCSSDADLPPYPDGSNGDAGMNQPSEKDDEITTVPFTITLGGLSSSDGNAKQDGRNTRVAPPGAGSSSSSGTIGEDNGYAETDNVNAVRLIAFAEEFRTMEKILQPMMPQSTTSRASSTTLPTTK